MLMIGVIVILPLTGLAPLTRGLAPYLLLLTGIVAGGFVAVTQAGVLGVPASHVAITLYLAASSVVMAAFFAQRPDRRIRLVMSAYMVAAVIAAGAALIGYFSLVPGAYDLFTEFGRARGTFKDPNVLGAFLVPALLYAFNVVMIGAPPRATCGRPSCRCFCSAYCSPSRAAPGSISPCRSRSTPISPSSPPPPTASG